MKLRVFFTSWFVVNILTNAIWADPDLDQQNFGSEEITAPAKQRPFDVNTHLDVISPSKINKGYFKGDEVRYAEAEIEAGLLFYYCQAYTEGARLAISYTPTYLRWTENPWFEQDHFNVVSLTLTGFSQRLNRWFWRTQLSVNLDAKEWSAEYTSYDILLWGRYEYSKRVGIHIGFFAQTGLRQDRVYPILGADWQISRKWKLNLVYPVNVSLDYTLTPTWSLSIAGRNFNSRFRVHHNEIYSKALVRYTNVGAEFAIKYQKDDMTANIHAGTTLGGNYRVANRHNHHAHNYPLKPAGYIGGEVDVKF